MKRSALASCLFLFCGTALGYEPATHSVMSAKALDASILGSLAVLERFGLRPLSLSDPRQTFSNSEGKKQTIANLVRFGSAWEDDRRTIQGSLHFFNPVDGSGLTAFGVTAPSSPNFGLEDVTDFGAGQPFSYKKGRNYIYQALVSPSEVDRAKYWGLTFQTLGHVAHHLQDMAQPQHVRNDLHCDQIFPCAIPPLLYLVFNPSGYEKWLLNNPPADSALGGYSPVFSAGANTPFLTPRTFWTTSPNSVGIGGIGIAEYTNRGFLSFQTNVSNNNFERPAADLTFNTVETLQSLCNEAVALGRRPCAPGLTGSVRFRGNRVADTFRPSSSRDNPRATTFSIFDTDLVARNFSAVYTLNRFTYDAAADLLLPRAVAYSAGLINYFFRGKLQISLPDEGVYGVVDHVLPSGKDPLTGGFGKIKLKIQNMTSKGIDGQGNPIIEPMAEGLAPTLVAVAKFRRNNCYQADLSGEYGSLPRPGGQTPEQCRSPVEEIVVSDPASVPTGINEAARPVTFTFTTKIPISATDLFLQVVYRGPLGSEPDAVVVETKDISEPSYVYNYSRSDQYKYSSYPSTSPGPFTFAEWCTQGGYASIEDCNAAHGFTLKFAYSFDSNWVPGYDPAIFTIPQETWTDIAQEPPFTHLAKLVGPVGKFNRVAVLLDAVPSNKGLVVHEWIDPRTPPANFKWAAGTPQPTINQWNYATSTLTRSVSYLGGRGVFVGASEAELLNGGTAENIPPLILAPSEIGVGW